MVKRLLGILATAIGLAAGPAYATAVYTIDVPNSALTPFAGPYATVSVTLIDATHATIQFDSAINGGFLYLMGGQGAADLEVNGTYTLGSFSATGLSNPGFSAPIFSGNNPGNVSSFGVFNLSVDLFDGFSSAATSISFELTNTGGTWASDTDVLVANADGNFAAVHSFACAVTGGNPATCDHAAGAAVTGFAGNDTGPSPRPAPEPTPLALIAIGLLAVAWSRKRRDD